MKNFTLLATYLQDITIGWFAKHDLPPDTVRGYDELVQNIEYRARGNGETAALCSELGAALKDEEFDFSPYAGRRYRYSNAALREISAHLLERLILVGDSQGDKNKS